MLTTEQLLVIELENNSHGLLRICVDEQGKIIDTNLHESVCVGDFVDLKKLAVGENIVMHFRYRKRKWNKMDFIIKSIRTMSTETEYLNYIKQQKV